MKKVTVGSTFTLNYPHIKKTFTVLNYLELETGRFYEAFEHGPDKTKYFNADILERHIYVMNTFLKPIKAKTNLN